MRVAGATRLRSSVAPATEICFCDRLGVLIVDTGCMARHDVRVTPANHSGLRAFQTLPDKPPRSRILLILPNEFLPSFLFLFESFFLCFRSQTSYPLLG